MKINSNEITINCQIEGPDDAPAVFLSHSLSTDLSMWDPLAHELADRFRVVRFDSRGHGQSDITEGAYDFDTLVEDVTGLADALNIERFHLVGLSMGGMMGQHLALAYPDKLRSLTLCSTTSHVPTDMAPLWDTRIQQAQTHGMAFHVEPTIERWFTQPFRDQSPPVIDAVRTMIGKTPVAGYVGWSHAIQTLNITERLPAIKTPTLIVVGEEDIGTPVSASQTIHKQISGSELVIIERSSHMLGLERPEPFNHAISSFLDRQPR